MHYIRDLIDHHPVLLFMKGSPDVPACGFSRLVVHILNRLRVPFAFKNVLEEPDLREDLKIFSQWPTFPQLYVRGQLIGGCDIVRDMYEKGELVPLFDEFIQKE